MVKKMEDEKNDIIAIIDMGSQYVSNFVRILGEKGIDSIVLPFSTKRADLKRIKPKGIIISGGPYSVRDKKAPKADDVIVFAEDFNTPLLGVCYGHQLIAERYQKGIVSKSDDGGEYGFSKLNIISKNETLFDDIPPEFICWMSHGDRIKDLPSNMLETARSLEYNYAAIKHAEKDIFGLQFHPEVTHTQNGDKIINNFSSNISSVIQKIWDEKEFVEITTNTIQEEVSNKKILAAVSGGVDSTLAAVIAQKSISNDNLLCIHVDTGMMRKKESKKVVDMLKQLNLNVKCINASDRFLEPLKNAKDSDTRRKIIGEIFVRIFEEEAKKFGAKYLLQATIAPDVIESTKGESKKINDTKHGGCIKLHHNVGGLPDSMELDLLEPLKDLFKYQVRILSRYLGIPQNLSERQPQPGPSAAVRIIEQLNKKNIGLWQDINKYVEEELKTTSKLPDQFFSVLIPNRYEKNNKMIYEIRNVIEDIFGSSYDIQIKAFEDRTVGVKGDERAYGKTIGVGIYDEGKLAWNQFDYLDLLKLQSKITGRIDDVVRVGILNSNSYNFRKKYAIIIRAVDTRDFMTAMPTDISHNKLEKIDNYILNNYPDIGATYYDITTKPSSTIEYL